MPNEPLDLDAIEALAPAANAAAMHACCGRARMSIPVRADDDDLVLLRAISLLPRLCARVRELEQEATRSRATATLQEMIQLFYDTDFAQFRIRQFFKEKKV